MTLKWVIDILKTYENFYFMNKNNIENIKNDKSFLLSVKTIHTLSTSEISTVIFIINKNKERNLVQLINDCFNMKFSPQK